MTTIIMVQLDDDVKIGSDSQTTAGGEVWNMTNPKVIVNNGIIIGTAGEMRLLDILEYTDLPAYEDDIDARKWMVTKFVPHLRAAFTKAEIKPMDEDGCYPIGLLVVVDGQVFEIDSSLAVGQVHSGLYSVGSGHEYALGALEAGATVMEALTIARNHDNGTGGELTVVLASNLLYGHS